MKKKLFTFIMIILVFFILIVTFLNIYKKDFIFNTNKINYIIVQYKSNKIVIDKPENVKEFCENFKNIRFNKDCLVVGNKGWKYWVKCYDNSHNLIYDFFINTDDVIIYKYWFYKVHEGKINYNYLENLFH